MELQLILSISTPLQYCFSTMDNSTAAPNQTLTTIPTKTKAWNAKGTNSPSAQNLQQLIDNENSFDIGYDTDGEIVPFSDAILQEGQQLFYESDKLPSQATTPTPVKTQAIAVAAVACFAPHPPVVVFH